MVCIALPVSYARSIIINFPNGPPITGAGVGGDLAVDAWSI